ncbi:MAG: hypothetical protein R3B13_34940 [Polyangiaceae bacterium]
MKASTWPTLAVLALASACAGSQPGAKPPERFGRASGGFDAAPLLGRDSSAARQAGADESQVLGVEPGAAGDRVTAAFFAPRVDCALVIARGSESIDDLDLFVYGDDGEAFGSDEAPDKNPAILICPPHPHRMLAVARVAAGHGVVALGVQRVPKAHVAAVRAALMGRIDESAAAREQARVEARLRAHRRELGGAFRELRRVALAVDARLPTRSSLAVRGGHCLDLLAIPAPTLGTLDLELLDETGRVVGRGQPDGRDRFVVACSEVDATVTVQLRPRSGSGPVWLTAGETVMAQREALVHYASTIELGPVRPLAEARSALEDALQDMPYTSPQEPFAGTLATGTLRSVSLPPPMGCVRLDVIGGRPLFGLGAEAFTPGGARTASARGAGSLRMLLCGKEPLRLDLEARLSAGPVQVLSRREPDAPAALAAEPLAASRLMAEVWATAPGSLARDISGVRALPVSDSGLTPTTARIPLRRCMDFFAALGPGSRGLDLRVNDASSGELLARSHGAHAVRSRLCAPQGTRDVRVELGSWAGAGVALFATRSLDLR